MFTLVPNIELIKIVSKCAGCLKCFLNWLIGQWKTPEMFLFCCFFAVAYLNLGTSLIALGRCHEAASVLRDGTKLDGTGLRDRTAHETARISSLLQLGGLYADQGKLQRALAVYREALHTHPYNYPPQVSEMFLILIIMSSNLNVACGKWLPWYNLFCGAVQNSTGPGSEDSNFSRRDENV